MPELPEVETIARALREGGRGGPPVVGGRILKADLLWARTLVEPSPEILFARLPDQVIQHVGRRGKFLILELSLDYLLIHLRMSGDMRVEPAFDESGNLRPFQPHDRFALEYIPVDDPAPMRLAFNDARKFGRVWLVPDPRAVVGKLGPEPWDGTLTSATFFDRLHAVNRQIKPLLLDQTFIAGLGNIYTDEALHAAGIHPLRSSLTVTVEEASRLLSGIRAVLTEGIRRNGASFDWVYRGGDFQNSFSVYQRAGKPCPRCGAPVMKISVGQRGTHYCEICQRLYAGE